MKPLARRDGLLIRELPGELLVYERDEHRAHCLNGTAAAVFKNADGTRSVVDLALLVASQGDRAEGEAVVTEALACLADAGLLEDGPAAARWSRREVIRRVGIGTALLLPVVVSVMAPTPAEAAATCVSRCQGQPDFTPCTCSGANPCTASCISESCSDGGGC